MTKLIVRILSLLLLLAVEVALPLRSFAQTDELKVTLPSDPVRSTNIVRPSGGPNDQRISGLTTAMLERLHFLKLPFDTNVSSRFLDHYLNTLDPQRIHFLQSDIDEFNHFRTALGPMTKSGDTSPAYVIFNRFMDRLEERNTYSTNALFSDGPFDYTADEKVLLNRKDRPYPKDMDEAKKLWSERIRYEYLQERLAKESPESVAKLLVSRHGPLKLALTWHEFHTDIVQVIWKRYSRTIRFFREWDGEKVLETYLTALAHAYDPRSDYMDKSDLENFSIQMSLSLFGIGATLQSEDGYCKINELNPSGPAAKSKKLKAKDRIVAVAQTNAEPVDVVDMPLTKVVEMIRGPKGTQVRLTIIPADAADPSTRTEISLIRDEIKLEDQQAKAKIVDLPDGHGLTNRLGVIDLPSFYQSFPLAGSTDKPENKSATEDVARLLEKLKREKVKGVILDLRRNPGGSLDEAINLSGLFLKDGPMVQTKDYNGRITSGRDENTAGQYDGPLVVLTSKFSASASEILAGALQDYGRALIVGDASTHGKGSVQRMSQLAPLLPANALPAEDPNGTSLGALKFTTSKFYRPSGASTQLKGVVPDLILPSVDDYLEVGEAYLDNPLPYDTIPSAKFEKVNRVQYFLPELRNRSNERVTASRDYAYVKEDIEQVKKALADKSVSLNESQRLKEKEIEEARRKTRDNELKARRESDETTYEITLKNVNDAGLPAPVLKTNSMSLSAVSPKSTGPGQGKINLNTVASTNAASASTSNGPNIADIALSAKTGEGIDDEEVEKVPVIDVNLVEAEQILIDYINLLPKETALGGVKHTVQQ